MVRVDRRRRRGRIDLVLFVLVAITALAACRGAGRPVTATPDSIGCDDEILRPGATSVTTCSFSLDPAEDLRVGGVTGIVRDEEGRPVAGVQVDVSGTSVPARLNYTDAGGVFRIGRVGVGQVTVSVHGAGYVTADYPASVTAGSSTVVDIKLRRDPQASP